MKIRNIKTKEIGNASNFNIHSLSEIFVYFDDYMDTDYIKDYEVFIKSVDKWMSFTEAFKQKLIITDNYNTHFFEPETV